MTASNFELLLQLIGPNIKKQDSNMREAIPISTRLAVTLRFLATGVSYHTLMYRVSQEERTKLREGVPYFKLYRYNPKHLYPKLNGYGDNGQRSLKL